MRAAGVLAAVFVWCNLAVAQEVPPSPQPTKDNQGAASESEAEQRLRKLLKSDDYETALNAAWRATLDAPSHPAHESPEARMAWLLGYFDGKLPVVVPDWWKTVVASAQRTNQNHLGFSRGEFWLYERCKSPYSVAAVSLREGAHGMILQLNGLDVPLDAEIVDKEERWSWASDPMIAAQDSKGAVYFARASDSTSPYKLWKIDGQTGRVLWSSPVEGVFYRGGHTGRSFHFVEIVFDSNEDVFVFGASSLGIYVEQFRSKSGKAVFRFQNGPDQRWPNWQRSASPRD